MLSDDIRAVLFAKRDLRAKQDGERVHFRCPRHDDNNPSAWMGGGSWGCFACGFTESIETLADALGVQKVGTKPMRDTIVGEYDYVDEDGTLLYQVVRYIPKRFVQRKPDGHGGWDWKTRGVRRVLYRLPEVLQAVEEGRFVFITEGEKHADRLRRGGLVATTNAGGAGKWLPDYSEALRGAHVVILPDNDEPGERHAQDIARSLLGVAETVRIVRLGGLREKGDVLDWLDAGHTLDELSEIAYDTPPNAPPAEESDEPDEPEAEGLPRAIPARDVGAEDAAMPFAGELGTAGEVWVMAGEGGVYKTTVGIHLCAATAVGAEVFGHSAFRAEAGPALFISEEDSAAVLRNKLEAVAAGHGWNLDVVLDNVHIMAMTGATLDAVEWQEHIIAEARRLSARLVVLDPLYDLTGVKETNDDLKPVIRFARRLAHETRCVPLIMHHVGKAAEGKSKLDRIRGASALARAARVIYYLEETPAGIGFECLKMSRAEKPAPFVVKVSIEAYPHNRMQWKSARMDYASRESAELSEAEKFVVGVVRRAGNGSFNTTDIKNAAKGSGIAAVSVSQAINTLQLRGRLTYSEGPRGARYWSLADDLGGPSDNGADPEPEQRLSA